MNNSRWIELERWWLEAMTFEVVASNKRQREHELNEEGTPIHARVMDQSPNKRIQPTAHKMRRG